VKQSGCEDINVESPWLMSESVFDDGGSVPEPSLKISRLNIYASPKWNVVKTASWIT